MKEFIDKADGISGTPINRANMMAIQGFIGGNIKINQDGSITETFSNGETITTAFYDNGNVVETFSGKRVITKTTKMQGSSIVVEVS